MLSKALSNYPQFRFREGKKLLWNPVLKKIFANRPEERVRLALVDYLIMQAGIPTSRLSFESPVKLAGDKSSSRTDIISYDQEFNPSLLVECKAPEIKLTEKAAIQIARYNQKVEAPFLLISNGLLDFWFKLKDEQINALQIIPERFQSQKTLDYSTGYWQDRGFIGRKLHPEIRSYVNNQCTLLFGEPLQPVKFLNFDGFSPEFALSHYYRIFGQPENTKIGLSISSNPYGGTRLNGVLNQDGANTAFLSASLNLMFDGIHSNAEIHSAKGVKKLDLTKDNVFNFEQDLIELIPDICQLLLTYS
ncbi:MAG: type I restriction enzyme HsdR N-terminal domain-containing protein [Gracilimonas sp.]|nr:type I restriction enzyme HsdR N-terminal domain-containing protein [Gracilimonas sp.]